MELGTNYHLAHLVTPKELSGVLIRLEPIILSASLGIETAHALGFLHTPLIDCTARPSETLDGSHAPSQQTPLDPEPDYSQQDMKAFRWKHVELHVVDINGASSLQALIILPKLKSKTKQPKAKVMVLCPLPQALVYQDSLLLLIILGLLDHVRESISTWAQLESVIPITHGIKVQTRSAKLEQPVFRHIERVGKISELQTTRSAMDLWLRKLSYE